MNKEFGFRLSALTLSTIALFSLVGETQAQENVFPTTGNVGIGTRSPQTRLDVRGELRTGPLAFTDGSGVPYPSNWIGMANNIDGATKWLHIGGITDAGARRLTLWADRTFIQGNVGIGTTNPQTRLDVRGGLRTGPLAFTDENGVPYPSNWIGMANNIDGATKWLHIGGITDAGARRLTLWADRTFIQGNVGIGTTNPAAQLDVSGTTRTRVLQITGGADLAETFEVAAAEAIEPGMLVSIDPAQPGQLRIASQAYDRAVAGVISGANGLNPGLTMGQDGTAATGHVPVSLTGRVYTYVDAVNGPIEPGDLLTTSNIPGHAMKVADHARAQGAIIGKAMTALANGRGLALVLVSLQ
jgi:hypothetical protein